MSGGQEGVGGWLCGSIGKHQGELASERQASWQAYGLLITQGLPPPLGAVSNMRGRNQPLKNRSPPQSTTDRVCVCVCTVCRPLHVGLALTSTYFFLFNSVF